MRSFAPYTPPVDSSVLDDDDPQLNAYLESIGKVHAQTEHFDITVASQKWVRLKECNCTVSLTINAFQAIDVSQYNTIRTAMLQATVSTRVSFLQYDLYCHCNLYCHYCAYLHPDSLCKYARVPLSCNATYTATHQICLWRLSCNATYTATTSCYLLLLEFTLLLHKHHRFRLSDWRDVQFYHYGRKHPFCWSLCRL